MSEGFRLEAFLNPNLHLGATSSTVTFTVSGGLGAQAPKARRVVILVLDTSESMKESAGDRGSEDKMTAAKRASRVMVSMIPPDVEFMVVTFANKATVVVPRTLATPQAVKAAHERIQAITAGRTTYMSYAIAAVLEQLRGCENAICTAAILTDGANASEDASALDNQVRLAKGHFQAHCRGLGLDWNRAGLQLVSDPLMGTLGLVATTDKLEADFRSILDTALNKSLSDLRLRMWMPKAVTLRKLSQMYPTELDLTTRMLPTERLTMEFPLGDWGNDSQDYLAVFETPAREPDGMSTAVCRASLVYTDPTSRTETVVPCHTSYDPPPEWQDVREGMVEVAWTDNSSLTMRANKAVSHYLGESEKAEAKREFADAMDSGDEATATVRLQKVMRLAEESGDEETKRMVRRIADVEDDTGTVTLRRRDTSAQAKADMMEIEVGSVRTVRARRA